MEIYVLMSILLQITLLISVSPWGICTANSTIFISELVSLARFFYVLYGLMAIGTYRICKHVYGVFYFSMWRRVGEDR